MTNRKTDLWSQYLKEKSPELREKIIVEYAPLIKYSALRIYQGLPKNIELDDLLSYGALGLIDAVDRYDANLNSNFEYYAKIRIRGAILDGLRKMDWAPQTLRRKAKALEKAYASLEQELGRYPTEEEVASFLGIKEEDLEKQLQDIGYLNILALEQPIENSDNDLFSLADFIKDQNSPEPSESIEYAELQKSLADAIQSLNDQEKMVITLYYYEELTSKEISKILELSEGRISQIHKKAVLKLKSKLNTK
ncbi:MAG: FliA/WhiG family RNA polymerase sigma factor [Clostridia bacterium]|jgi:RNA polymerase sigma factor for flagellar operon FliA|nr:FliA/WhiG family RNA polymerase sigma factor [Clostridia bacterium]